jgi:2-polyprenyl-3-methyl-5-hydroxy-6-metoxy-1,4-benzoquinol methylase
VVILFEAIYYLARAEQFARECHRVLRPNGLLLLCSANKKWPGFTTSPYATRYFDAEELRQLIVGAGFDVKVYGAFPEVASTVSKKAVALIRSVAVRLNLIPGSLKGRELLKRFFYGRLSIVTREIDGNGTQPARLYSIEEGQASSEYRILYAAGHAKSQ